MGHRRLAALALGLAACSLLACAPSAATRVRSGDAVRLPRDLVVLPLVDRSGAAVSAAELQALQQELANDLRKSGRFTSVSTPSFAGQAGASARVEVALTQIDLGARRVVAVTLVSAPDGAKLLELDTHSDMVSIAWPFDYIGATSRLLSATVGEIAAQLSRR